MERGKTPREGWAALVLRHYHQRRAGVARIRQTWLPTARLRQPDQASQPACVAHQCPRPGEDIPDARCVLA